MSQTSAPLRLPSRLPFWANLQLLILTFILVGVGGGVTSTDSGMAVPDWPGTGGEFMLFSPFKFWAHDMGRVLEHSHRLIGSAVGMAAIAVAVINWKHAGERKWLRWLGLALLAGVVLQGLLGGFRVSDNSPLLAAFHGVFGQLLFALMTLSTLAWSRAWPQSAVALPGKFASRLLQKILVVAPVMVVGLSLVYAGMREAPAQEKQMQWHMDKFLPPFIAALSAVVLLTGMTLLSGWRALRQNTWKDKSRSTRTHAWLMLGFLALQLCLGAAVRHGHAEHAIQGLTMAPAMSQKKINAQTNALMADLAEAGKTDPKAKERYQKIDTNRTGVDDQGNPILPAGKVHLHYTHRLVGYLIGLIAIGWLVVLKKRKALVPVPFLPKLALGAAVGLQIALGMFTVLSGVHAVYATSHQTGGALLLAATVWLSAWCCLASNEKA